MDLFSPCWAALRAAVADLAEADFVRPSGCAGRLVRDLVCHLVIGAPPQPDGADRDTYPMADEYAPGKFCVVREADTVHNMVGRLDVSGTAEQPPAADRSPPPEVSPRVRAVARPAVVSARRAGGGPA